MNEEISVRVRNMYNLIIDILCTKKFIKKLNAMSIACPSKLVLHHYDDHGNTMFKSTVSVGEISDFLRHEYAEIASTLQNMLHKYKEHLIKDASHATEIHNLFDTIEYLNDEELMKHAMFGKLIHTINELSYSGEVDHRVYSEHLKNLHSSEKGLKHIANNISLPDSSMFKLAYGNFKNMDAHLVSGLNNVF